jgi:prepilin-type N-terminal cleavage/methylation domain-containing protein
MLLINLNSGPTPRPQRTGLGNRMSPVRRGGFTLIEILIVVAILGILAAIVVPELSSASRQAREGVMKDDVRFMREQILRYRIQHDDIAPGYPAGNPAGAPTSADFVAQMTLYTDFRGNTAAAYSDTFRYGPYLTKIPDNPLTGVSGIDVVVNGAALPAPDKTQPYGWIYKPETLEFVPNMPGADLDGKAYTSY